jgi:hypothetical protein
VKYGLVGISEDEEQGGEGPGVSRGMGVAAEVHFVAHEDVLDVAGVEGVDEGVLGFGEIDVVVALDDFTVDVQPHAQHCGQEDQEGAARWGESGEDTVRYGVH